MRAVNICLLCLLVVAGCATTSGRRGLRPPTHPAEPPQTDVAQAPTQHCPDRINRARAGGTVGSVVGFVAASALGSPLMGILYQAGGYAAGIASVDHCRKDNGAVAAVQTSNADPAAAPPDKIAEEDVK